MLLIRTPPYFSRIAFFKKLFFFFVMPIICNTTRCVFKLHACISLSKVAYCVYFGSSQ